jgi:RNA polymerase sigma-70 factor (ECF subfamily)
VAELVAAARDGDAVAFRLLVDRYYARALRFAGNMGLAAEDAEEAVQDAFVRAHGALGRFDSRRRSSRGCSASSRTAAARRTGAGGGGGDSVPRCRSS